MKKRHLATKVSNSLSAGILVLAILAAAANHRQAQPRPEGPEPPEQEPAAAVEGTEDRPSAVPSIVLPPPPSPPTASESGEAKAPRADAPRESESKAEPRRTIEALKVEPRNEAPKPTTQFSALRPRPPAEESQPPSQDASPPAPAAPAQEESDRQEPVEVFERQPREDLAVVAPGQVALAEGRRLLRLLEHGSGPTVELAWPARESDRLRLYQRLQTCYGMRVALLDRDDRIFIAEGAPGSVWEINRDRYSGFIRRPSGSLSDEERDAAKRIRDHHHGLSRARPIRVFPRRVDAYLLGGLRQLVGEDYDKVRTIRARYRLVGERLLLEEVTADGGRVAGRVNLSKGADRACR
ncbi:MAG: hypothetical protein QNI93_05200 [Kiloniellales bacterium]|nr:hypothetical protein [Kiloniellales bacterium]